MNLYKKYYRTDLLSGLVVFLVALPLCLGIAVASGAPPIAGIISGVIGGIVVGFLSHSNLSVTGPAAGLIAILLTAQKDIGFEGLLLAVSVAGLIQIILGLIKAGTISNYFPSNVIEGMLAAIGVIIIKKEIPHALGYDKAHEGDFFSVETNVGSDFLGEIIESVNYLHPGAMLVALLSIGILIAFQKIEWLKKIRFIPGALVAVIVGILINESWIALNSTFQIVGDGHLVDLPVPKNWNEFKSQFNRPDFSRIGEKAIWITGLTIAVVASIETLLCIEAGDKMDPLKRYTHTNRELQAQGVGNLLSGLLGGLPMTSVIVRTSANVNAGARTKISTITHGILLLLAVLLIPSVLNRVPMATLAAILILIGYKLAHPKVFKHMWKSGLNQFIPFMVTLIAVVSLDLLKGVGIGLLVSIFYILKQNLKLAYFFRKENHHQGETITITLAQEVSFLNKAAIKKTLGEIADNSKLIIDASQTAYIDYDVLQLIRDFLEFGSREKGIAVQLIGFKEHYRMEASSHVSSH
ncbi:MAG TPA: SulP family inorganic anion transporter [Chitinophagaceae bacterium]|nr:SulP family inorganic anion transporter [Chitinophagaceae bacterium]HNF70800.1 SulP family inorganic anion transporter [Chitinophagaceae bacterium]